MYKNKSPQLVVFASITGLRLLGTGQTWTPPERHILSGGGRGFFGQSGIKLAGGLGAA